VNPSGKYLYAVNEMDHFGAQKSGAASAFSIDQKTGKLTLLNQVATRGAGPCHISLDKSGKFALVANYDGGSVATFPAHADGTLARPLISSSITAPAPTKNARQLRTRIGLQPLPTIVLPLLPISGLMRS